MLYLNIELASLRAPEFANADPVHQATWLKLMAYCADQETSGFIRDAHRWRDFQWFQLGINPEVMKEPSDLWRSEVGHLKVWGYPLEQERVIRSKRKGGKLGNKRRWSDKVVEMPAKYQAGPE